jgi:hypothetical protein
MDRFRETLEFCQLKDLVYEGDTFTWRNHNHVPDNYIRERLDKAVANHQWRAHFLAARVVNGDPRHSDHRPLIITTEKSVRGGGRSGERGFKFEASWLKEDKCREVVEDVWNQAMEQPSASVHDELKGVAVSLTNWSQNVLGDLKRRVRKVKELEECRRLEIGREQVAKEEVLRYKLERLEEQVDIFWKQRAHVNWLQKGDRNTSFFHAACKERRKKNRIERPKREDGEWMEREEEKRTYIANYFSVLFRSNGGQTS